MIFFSEDPLECAVFRVARFATMFEGLCEGDGHALYLESLSMVCVICVVRVATSTIGAPKNVHRYYLWLGN